MQVTATWATDRKRFSRALGPGSIKMPFTLTPSSLFPVTISKLVLSPPYLLNSPASVFFFFFFFIIFFFTKSSVGFIIYFIFWLWCVFVAARRLSLVAETEGYSLVAVCGLLSR